MNIKLILESWKQYNKTHVLDEGMVQPENLEQDMLVFVSKLYNPKGYKIEIDYVDQDGNRLDQDIGTLDFTDAEDAYMCQKNPYQISIVGAIKGYGPLLYDIALELAGDRGITCDKFSTTKDAANVWKHYYFNRPDVKNELIKCRGTTMSSRWGKDWVKEYPWLSSRFIKPNKTQLTKLKALGKLRMMI